MEENARLIIDKINRKIFEPKNNPKYLDERDKDKRLELIAQGKTVKKNKDE